MNIKDEQLTGKNTQIRNEEEIKKAINSLKKLREYNVENVITYHSCHSTTIPIKKLKN
ncbi:hypothetical protein [Methanobacterium sp.]|jgi:hypothetical protein|uniref:hypothetical protein n=1 Tax=Methanobacterium sp. TaxID=2164 RepID=UPI0031595908